MTGRNANAALADATSKSGSAARIAGSIVDTEIAKPIDSINSKKTQATVLVVQLSFINSPHPTIQNTVLHNR
jgi:ACT domain-containing protein